MVVAVWALLVSTGAAGHTIFIVLVAIASMLAMLTGIFVASDSICRERREGTLGFLFLTDLRPADVVTGKLAAAGLVPMYALLAMFPALALCQLVGGIHAGLFWSAIIALILSLFFSLSATIYVSSLCEDHRKAYSGSTFLLFVANPLWLGWTAVFGSRSRFFLAVFIFTVLSFLFLRATATRLARHWRDFNKPLERPKKSSFHSIPVALLDAFPVAWMMLRRQPFNGALRILGFTLFALVALISAPIATTAAGARQMLWLLFAIHLIYQFVLIARTAYSFYIDRQNGALELLLGTRLDNEEIFAGFNRFLLRKSAPFITLLTVLDILFACVLGESVSGPLAALPIGLASGLWITLLGLGWLGVYRSLMMRHPSLAMLATFARLSFVPAIFSLLFLNIPRTDHVKVAIFYVVSSAFLAIFFSLDAKGALAIHGRTLLLRPYSEKPPHIENEWTFIDWEEGREAESSTSLQLA